MTTIAIIGGSGLTQLNNLKITRHEVMRTPYGEPSGPMVFGQLGGNEVAFLPRHGPSHTIPPHLINYRANLWALKEAGVRKVIAVAAVGGITEPMEAGRLVFPDQIVDYTYSRAHTFSDGSLKKVMHAEFTHPYDMNLRAILIDAARRKKIPVVEHGTYGATQGPRFETAAEIVRMERDGCDIVGMTGMPEAGLARELDLAYATVAVVANRAAGKEATPISLKEIEAYLEAGMVNVRAVLEQAIPLIKQG